MDNYILLFPAWVSFSCESDVIEAWNNNADFRTPREKTAYMRKSGFEMFGNKMCGIRYIYGGLDIIIRSAIS